MTKTRIKSIYLMDDSSDEIYMTRLMLERGRSGLDFRGFQNVNAFFEFLAFDIEFDPLSAIIIVDMNIGLDRGTDLINRIRKLKDGNLVTAGITTGSEDPLERSTAMRSGADFFVGKPIDINVLKDICDQVKYLSIECNSDGMFEIFRS